LLVSRAWLLAMLGRVDEASQLAGEAGERWRELTGDDRADFFLAHIAATLGDYDRAAAHWRRSCDMAEAGIDSGFLQTYAPLLGRSLCMLGRHDEAEPLAKLGRALDKTGQDVYTQALWRQVEALVHSSRGGHTEAAALAREAVAIMEPTDALAFQGDALCDLAEVLLAGNQSNEAAAAHDQAINRYERKNNLAMAAQARARFHELHVS
jgi:tetratricopeptide (TPR) repeat protein